MNELLSVDVFIVVYDETSVARDTGSCFFSIFFFFID